MNSKWINIILLAIESPIIYFLSSFSLGEPTMIRANFEVHPYERFFVRLCAVSLLLFVINIIIIFGIKMVINNIGEKPFKFNLFKTLLFIFIFLQIITFIFVLCNLYINGFV